MSFSKTGCFVYLFAIMLAPACAQKSEPPVASPETTPAATSDAAAVVESASGEGVFKYTITTDIVSKNDNIEILVAMNSREIHVAKDATLSVHFAKE